MTGRARCTACGRETGDGALACVTCEAALVRLLTEAEALLRELDVQLTRQAVTGSGGPRGADHALPFDPVASDVRAALGNGLTTWARHYGMGER